MDVDHRYETSSKDLRRLNLGLIVFGGVLALTFLAVVINKHNKNVCPNTSVKKCGSGFSLALLVEKQEVGFKYHQRILT
jgi:hypothetical protein